MQVKFKPLSIVVNNNMQREKEREREREGGEREREREREGERGGCVTQLVQRTVHNLKFENMQLSMIRISYKK